jgi:integrase
MKARGTGLIFQPTYKDRKTGEIKTSSIWYIQYSVRGKRIRENSDSRKQAVAARLLKKRIGEAAAGKPVGPDVEKTTLADLKRMIEDEYTANGRRSSVIKSPLAHLVAYFGESCRAFEITTDRLTAYITKRQADGAANATINRSLAALKRAFRLAERAGRVATRPYIPMLEENNARSGFLSHAEFLRLQDALPEDLRDPVAFLYYSGWRVSEMRALEWRDTDLAGGVVRLRPENSKTKHARTLPLRGELKAILDRADAKRILDCMNVFHRADGGPIALFRKSWATACDKAKVGAILVHDLRRTAVRNLIRAGVPEHTAMAVTGHKTASIFRRYDIVTEDDLARAVDSVNTHLEAQPKKTPANVVPIKKSDTAHVQPKSADLKAVGE